tara:strand:- start:71 stop:475 length:405 start_codon:yes stop_codon:yes gene_type:complete
MFSSREKQTKKIKKRRITELAVTQAHSVFKRDELDTVAGLTRRIFLCKGVVQGRSRSGSYARQCETSKNVKNAKKRRCTLIGRNSSAQRLRTLKIGHGAEFGQAHLFVRRSCSGTVKRGHAHANVKIKKKLKKK